MELIISNSILRTLINDAGTTLDSRELSNFRTAYLDNIDGKIFIVSIDENPQKAFNNESQAVDYFTDILCINGYSEDPPKSKYSDS